MYKCRLQGKIVSKPLDIRDGPLPTAFRGLPFRTHSTVLRVAERDMDSPLARLFSCHRPPAEDGCTPAPGTKTLPNLAFRRLG